MRRKLLILLIGLGLVLGLGGVCEAVISGKEPAVGLDGSMQYFVGSGYITDGGSADENKEGFANKVIPYFVRYIGTVVAGLAVLFLVIAGLQYLTAGGEEEKLNKAKGNMKIVLLALGLMLLSYSIVKIVISFTSIE